MQAWLPDSPRWLLLAGRGQEAAERALRRARGRYGVTGTAVRDEILQMKRVCSEASAPNAGRLAPLQL